MQATGWTGGEASGKRQQVTDHAADGQNNHGSDQKSKADHSLAPKKTGQFQIQRRT